MTRETIEQWAAKHAKTLDADGWKTCNDLVGPIGASPRRVVALTQWMADRGAEHEVMDIVRALLAYLPTTRPS